MDDLHLEADLFFGPCLDRSLAQQVPLEAGQLGVGEPVGAQVGHRGPVVDLSWPSRDHLRLVARDGQPPEFG